MTIKKKMLLKIIPNKFNIKLKDMSKQYNQKNLSQSYLSQSVNDYNKNGYVILKNVIPNSRIDALLENIYKLYCKYSMDSEFDELEYPWKSELFHKKLIEFRKKEPKLFGAIYDSLKTSLTLTQLVSDDRIVDIYTKSRREGILASQRLEYELVDFENELWEF